MHLFRWRVVGFQRKRTLLFAFFCLLAVSTAAQTATPSRIAIVIDDLGELLSAGRRVIKLPGPVACAFLPNTRHAYQLANLAHQSGKEILLHQPMQSISYLPQTRDALVLDMTRLQLQRVVNENLDALPYVSGMNNHMGSLLTQHPGHMRWLMELLHDRGGLFYIDSRTTTLTVAEQTARDFQVPVVRRHVFLDHPFARGGIEYQFERLLKLARRNGYAVAIGHPHPKTLSFLEEHLPLLATKQIELVPVIEILTNLPKTANEMSIHDPGMEYPTDF